MARLVGVKFNKACKVYDFDPNGIDLRPGEMVVVEVEKGLGMGTVAYRPKDGEPLEGAQPPEGTQPLAGKTLKKVIRKADKVDLERHDFNTERESEARRICREKIAQFNLPMKLVRVEYLFDSSKAIFFFTSETRVDFRELVKDLASFFHTRIEMRQIGVRDEAKMLGGLGPCGRVLCCTGHLTDFEPVTIKMAKDQNLALNPVKISGICGRLMCCLSYEHAMYKSEKLRKAAAAQAGTAAQTAGAPQAEKGGCGCGGRGEHRKHGEVQAKVNDRPAREEPPKQDAAAAAQPEDNADGKGHIE
ncbi:MAG: stage 0 sporulation protein [Deltaproteobacteria bacterium]|nr:stage 0 sporulation protein [Deltaproteobacteria bacterium]